MTGADTCFGTVAFAMSKTQYIARVTGNIGVESPARSPLRWNVGCLHKVKQVQGVTQYVAIG